MGADRAHSAQHPLPEQPRLVFKLRYQNHLVRLRIPPEPERPSCCNDMVVNKGVGGIMVDDKRDALDIFKKNVCEIFFLQHNSAVLSKKTLQVCGV